MGTGVVGPHDKIHRLKNMSVPDSHQIGAHIFCGGLTEAEDNGIDTPSARKIQSIKVN